MGKRAQSGQKPEPKLRGRLRPLAIALPPDLIEQLDAAAAAEHRSRTNMIEVMIHEGLAARQRERAA